MSYFQDIQDGIRTTLKGLSLTFRHIRQARRRRTPEGIASDNYFDQQNGLVTLQYPHEQLPIPDNGRYRLRNEIEDCIVCDKCAKICPVDCITIDAIKATEEVGRASDGSPIRLYAAKFDIDMAKCCYCGLCTVVCPTECLTMDKKFDYSEFELDKLTYSFAELTPEEADKKRALYEQFVREKEEAKAAQAAAKAALSYPTGEPTPAPAAKAGRSGAVFRPTAKPTPTIELSDAPTADALGDAVVSPTNPAPQPKKPLFRPTQKPKEVEKAAGLSKPESVTTVPDASKSDTTESNASTEPAKARPAFRPSMKPTATRPEVANSEDKEVRKPIAEQNSAGSALAHPLTDATPDEMERIAEAGRKSVGLLEGPLAPEPTPKPKPAFRPTIKPSTPPIEANPTDRPEATGERPKPKPTGFRPTMKPSQAPPKPTEWEQSDAPAPAASTDEAKLGEPPKSKPAFRPTMKPKPKPGEDESA